VINRAIRYTIGFFRRHCGLRLAPVWEIDDVRQTAAVHYLATLSIKAAAKLTWNEFRRHLWHLNRYRPGLPTDLIAVPCRGETIPAKYLIGCSDRERLALSLAYEMDLSGPEIADALGCTRKAANLLLIRGRAKARTVVA
jgi:hypothetical protein